MLRHTPSASACAVLVGSAAVLLWSTLATQTVWTGLVPPPKPMKLTFTVGGGLEPAHTLTGDRSQLDDI